MTHPQPKDRLPRKRLLFLRNYQRFTGGHLKWLHYLAHTQAHGRFHPLLHIAPNSKIDAFEPLLPAHIERTPLPTRADALFVAGRDWDMLDTVGQSTADLPVLNLVQHVRHADPALPLYGYLNRPATRICVSARVAEAITATGRVNGPVHVIENGLDLAELTALRTTPREARVFIAGLKAPDLAHDVAKELTRLGLPYTLQIDQLPRADYLARLAAHSHAILLPHPAEGFYLPALETMAMGTATIMPDCIGARGFALDDTSCVIAPRDPAALARAAAALVADPNRTARLITGGITISARHSLSAERQAFFAILDEFAA